MFRFLICKKYGIDAYKFSDRWNKKHTIKFCFHFFVIISRISLLNQNDHYRVEFPKNSSNKMRSSAFSKNDDRVLLTLFYNIDE